MRLDGIGLWEAVAQPASHSMHVRSMDDDEKTRTKTNIKIQYGERVFSNFYCTRYRKIHFGALWVTRRRWGNMIIPPCVTQSAFTNALFLQQPCPHRPSTCTTAQHRPQHACVLVHATNCLLTIFLLHPLRASFLSRENRTKSKQKVIAKINLVGFEFVVWVLSCVIFFTSGSIVTWNLFC